MRRLEHQLLYFQRLAFAALEYAQRQATAAAESSAKAPPAETEVRDAVLALMEQRDPEWNAKWAASEGSAADGVR